MPELLSATQDASVVICGVAYTVRLVDGPLVVRGVTTASVVNYRSRTIDIDNAISSEKRWKVAAVAVARVAQGLRLNEREAICKN